MTENCNYQDPADRAPRELTDDDVKAVLDELDALGSEDDEDEDDDELEYKRAVTAWFPEEVGNLFGVMNMTVPMRDFLEWAAAKYPHEAELLNGIRDEYFGGDHEEDYWYMMDPPTWLPPATEERCRMELARAAGRAEREAKREAFEAEEAKKLALEDEGSRPFLDREKHLMTKEALRIQKWKELHADWKAFIVEQESWGADRPTREMHRRAELERREAALMEVAIAFGEERGKLRAEVNARIETLRKSM